MSPSRRKRASCSNEIMALHRLISSLALNDPAISRAVLAAEGDMAGAARLYGIRADAFRQRHLSLLRRVIRVFPAIGEILKSGRTRPERLSYDRGKFAVATGIEAD